MYTSIQYRYLVVDGRWFQLPLAIIAVSCEYTIPFTAARADRISGIDPPILAIIWYVALLFIDIAITISDKLCVNCQHLAFVS